MNGIIAELQVSPRRAGKDAAWQAGTMDWLAIRLPLIVFATLGSGAFRRCGCPAGTLLLAAGGAQEGP